MLGTQFGHYQIKEKIGAGGMGEVYRATDTHLGRDVAIKVLPADFAHDEQRVARFRREAQLLASLNHNNIAVIHGFDEDAGRRFLVLELVPGDTLAQRIARGALPLGEALPLARQIAEGLEAAHEKGVVHRDLKPGNIKVTPEGVVKILDFGLAKAMEGENAPVDSPHSPTLSLAATRAGLILGTAAYMSPEQARGATVDKRADVWAFGCVLFEMLAGSRPFVGDTASDTLASVLKLDPDWNALPAATPAPVRQLLQRCLEKSARQRLHDIADARLEIEAALARPAESSRPDSTMLVAAPVGKWQRYLPWGIAGALALAVVALVAQRAGQQPSDQSIRFSMVMPSGTTLAAHNYPPAVISPDGRRIAFVVGRGDSGQLHVRELSEPQGKPIAGAESVVGPFFSPDGNWIGFTSHGKLTKVSVAGGAPIALTDAQWGNGTWGADDTIVYTLAYNSGLWRVPAAGGAAQKLTDPDHAQGVLGHWWPQLLPGGKSVLFTIFSTPMEKAGIAVLSLETGQQRVVLQGATNARYVPSGHLLFVRGQTLMAAAFDVNKLAVTGSEFPVQDDVAFFSSNGVASYGVSDTGRLLYVPASSSEEPQTLTWVDRQGNRQPLTETLGEYVNPRLSPDGRRLAVGFLKDATLDIWTYDLQRNSRSRFSFGPASEQAPVWTPDGKRVIYFYEAPIFDLYWKATDGTGTEEPLRISKNDKKPTSVSPDGKMLLFSESDAQNREDIWLLPLDDKQKPIPFLQTPHVDHQAMFSPNGRWVAYASDESGRSEVYVRPFPGPGPRTQVSVEGGSEPVWARSGRELFYRQGDKLMAAPVETGADFRPGTPIVLFREEFEAGSNTANYDVSPDGQRFILPRGESSPTLRRHFNVVLNFFEEIRRRAPPK